MELPGSVEQLEAPRVGERLSRQHQRHVLPSVRKLHQRLERLVRNAQGHDPIVPTVALDELTLDVFEGIPISSTMSRTGEGISQPPR